MRNQEHPRENPIHLPDIGFYHWCSERFFINRGVYNAIDHWFFEQGFKNIANRRTIIIQFLMYVQKEEASSHHKYVKFGRGGVKKKLHRFVQERFSVQ